MKALSLQARVFALIPEMQVLLEYTIFFTGVPEIQKTKTKPKNKNKMQKLGSFPLFNSSL